MTDRDMIREDSVIPIDFEKELYKAFGQVKDFTLGLRIAKRFYEKGLEAGAIIFTSVKDSRLGEQ